MHFWPVPPNAPPSAQVTARSRSPSSMTANAFFDPISIWILVRLPIADVAICLDGDADRVLVIDEKGSPIDGDQFLGMIGARWFKEGKLANETLVSTVMSNMRLETFLNQEGITLVRTSVGDRYVVESMRLNGFNLGGEK